MSKVIFVQIVVVACLASLVLSSSAPDKNEQVCHTCKKWVAKAKVDLPETLKLLESYKTLCKTIGIEEKVKKCEKIIDEVTRDFKTETPEQICTRVMMCGKTNIMDGPVIMDTPASQSTNVVCEACKKWLAKAKIDLPATVKHMEVYKTLCKNLDTKEHVKKCEKAVDDAIRELKIETPEQLCNRMMLCGKTSIFNLSAVETVKV